MNNEELRVAEQTVLDQVREAQRCFHCNSKSLLDKTGTIICENCGCIHTEDSWEFRIPVSKLDIESKRVSSWLPSEI